MESWKWIHFSIIFYFFGKRLSTYFMYYLSIYHFIHHYIHRSTHSSSTFPILREKSLDTQLQHSKVAKYTQKYKNMTTDSVSNQDSVFQVRVFTLSNMPGENREDGMPSENICISACVAAPSPCSSLLFVCMTAEHYQDAVLNMKRLLMIRSTPPAPCPWFRERCEKRAEQTDALRKEPLCFRQK